MIQANWKINILLWWMIGLADPRVVSTFRSYELEPRGGGRGGQTFQQERKPRLSIADWSTYNLREPNGLGTYAFGYDNVVDPAGNEQFRSEEKLENGTVVGEYGYTDHRYRRLVRVSYTADQRGYRAKTEILPLDDAARSWDRGLQK